jgi:hypothetical protein
MSLQGAAADMTSAENSAHNRDHVPEMVWTSPSHVGSERHQERRSPRYTRLRQSAKVVVVENDH